MIKYFDVRAVRIDCEIFSNNLKCPAHAEKVPSLKIFHDTFRAEQKSITQAEQFKMDYVNYLQFLRAQFLKLRRMIFNYFKLLVATSSRTIYSQAFQ